MGETNKSLTGHAIAYGILALIVTLEGFDKMWTKVKKILCKIGIHNLKSYYDNEKHMSHVWCDWCRFSYEYHNDQEDY